MSKKLAIQGHPTRGKEVIELLEMLGGVNRWKASGNIEKVYYSISNGAILYSPQIEKDTVIFTLEEFLKKYPFKVGDKVMDGYGDTLTIKSMSWSVDFETMVYDFKDSVIVLAAEDMKAVWDTSLKIGKNTNTGIEFDLTKYDYEVKDGKLVISEKKPIYPKLTNLTECKEILGERDMYQSVSGYKGEILTNFQLLFIFRDVYWKIAGEQLGLGKPWEPNWPKTEERKFCIIRRSDNTVTKWETKTIVKFLAFPTEEMRDAFFENFKDLIEKCKELL
jgi:hypothetical protein